MIIELRGVEFENKGAELMLHAIMQQVSLRFPKAIFTMELTRRVAASQLTQFGIYQKRGRKAAALPRFVRRRLRFVVDREVDVVLDGSGFAFGDQWGAAYAQKRLGAQIQEWQKQGKKVILLPQAFGPFKDAALRAVMEQIIGHAQLVFARETSSLQYLRDISNSSSIHLAPDFTNLIKGRLPAGFSTEHHEVAIIPNHKMIGKKTDDATPYLQFLVQAVTKVKALGLRPFFLIHEGQRDIAIAEKVNALLPEPIATVIDPDPLVIKGIIGSSRFIICSRFHGVVSALSQGIPCISTSWSHKYERLHEEYHFAEGIIKDLTDTQELDEKITQLLDPAFHQEVSARLMAQSKLLKEKSAAMWERVFKTMAETP